MTLPLPARLRLALVAVPATGLILAGAAWASGHPGWSSSIFVTATLPVLAALFREIVVSLRKGEVGLDIVAALSMTAALLFGEHLAAAVVALMYSGGQLLEAYADARARADMTALLRRVPKVALRETNGALEEVPIEAVKPGEHLHVRRGDIVPVDGTVKRGLAVLDQSALTGESLPVHHAVGQTVMSGSSNVGESFVLAATETAERSTFAGIVRLVEGAAQSKAPMSRLADRFALAFLLLTVLIAAAAWFISADPIRLVAVLVVATPCPLILAVPIAIVSGLSKAARRGVLIKGGKALELLPQIRSVIIDKTGTLTTGQTRTISESAADGFSMPLVRRLASSLEQASGHIIAKTIVDEAKEAGMTLSVPAEPTETPGEGIEGVVEGRKVAVGGRRYIAEQLGVGADAILKSPDPGTVTVFVAIDGTLAGTIIMADRVRTDAKAVLDGLKARQIERIVLATGDARAVAEAAARDLPIDAVLADLTPDQKVLAVVAERKNGPVMMIGDGVNDAPALAAADIGVAMGARGTAASAEIADVVLLVDRLEPLSSAIAIARRSRFIALESVYVGLGLSIGGMVAAALGFLAPVQGAVFQEVIDVAVILNALRAASNRSAGG